MNTDYDREERFALLRQMLPGCTEKELEIADQRLMDYLAFTVRMYDRIRADPVEYERIKTLMEQRKKAREGKFDSPRGSA